MADVSGPSSTGSASPTGWTPNTSVTPSRAVSSGGGSGGAASGASSAAGGGTKGGGRSAGVPKGGPSGKTDRAMIGDAAVGTSQLSTGASGASGAVFSGSGPGRSSPDAPGVRFQRNPPDPRPSDPWPSDPRSSEPRPSVTGRDPDPPIRWRRGRDIPQLRCALERRCHGRRPQRPPRSRHPP